MDDVVKDVKLVKLGDMEYPEDQLTAAEYFEYVKGLKQTVDDDYLQLVIDNGMKMIQKCKITRQTDMAKQIAHIVDVALREIKVSRDYGFNIFVSRKDIERYITNVDSGSVKIIELSRYTRDIPDDKVDILAKASECFDELYIVFTDYTHKDSQMVAKERRSKDPIVFGAFHDKTDENDSSIYVEDRLFFIADWVEDNCDLTLKEIVQDVKKKDKKDIVYKVNTIEDEEQIKNYLNSFKQPVSDKASALVPEKDFFGKLVDKVKKTTTSRKKKGTSKKKDSDE